MSHEKLVDLEAVGKDSLVDSTGVSYSRFRQSLRPNYRRAWTEIAAGYTALLVISAALSTLDTRLSASGFGWAFVGAIGFGYAIAFIHLFFHEAAHFHLASSRQVNDALTDFFMGPLLLNSIEFYRHIHMAHHTALGETYDTENSYHHPLTLRFLLDSLTGLKVISVLSNRKRKTKVSPAVQRKQTQMFYLGAGLHSTIALGAAAAGLWQLALAWCLGVGVFAPFFGAVRQLLEHRAGDAGRTNFSTVRQGRFTRVFHTGPIGSTFGAAGFNRHLIHHWDPTMSYTCFEDIERFILRTDLSDLYRNSKKTYWQTFWDLCLNAGRTDETRYNPNPLFGMR